MLKAIKRVIKMNNLALLMILQLTVGLTMLNANGFVLSNIELKRKNIDELFDINKTYACRIVPIGGFDSNYNMEYNKDIEKLINDKDIFNKLKQDGLVNRKMIYYTSLLPMREINENLIDKYKKLEIGKQMDVAAKILVNEDFIDRFDIKVVEGRTFTKEDFNKDYKENIPIILGHDFIQKFDVGDIIKEDILVNFEKNNNIVEFINFEVIGFLDKNALIGCDSTLNKYTSRIYYSDSLSAIPIVRNAYDLSEIFALEYKGLLLELNDGITIESIKERLDKDLNKYDLVFNYESLTGIDGMKEILSRDKNISLFNGFLVSFLAILGCTATILGSFINRNKEFGAKLFSGATLKDICKEIIQEIFVLTIVSSILSILFSIGTKPSINVIITNIMLICIITLLISILPILKLKNMQIVEIIKNKS
ncbi:MAG: FtsX-like permease family protein [Clostridium sp.]